MSWSDPNHDVFEGVSHDNACDRDSDGNIGGCGSEVCSAEKDVVTRCIAYPNPPTGTCGCVAQVCVWNDVCE